MNDSLVDRAIGLCALVVGFSVLFFAVKMPLDPKSNVPLIRKAVGGVIAVGLVLYGLYALIFG